MVQKKKLARYGMLLSGAFILAFGLFNVHSQSRITEGGVLGTTLLINHWLVFLRLFPKSFWTLCAICWGTNIWARVSSSMQQLQPAVTHCFML